MDNSIFQYYHISGTALAACLDYCYECPFRWVCSYHILSDSNFHLSHHHHIYCCNSYGNNDINGIKASPTWFLLAIFTILSIIPSHQLLFGLKLCLFIKFINDDISCSHKCNCKSLKMTLPINNEKLINLVGLDLLLLLPLPKSLVVAIQIVFFHQIHQWRHQLQS